MFREKKTETSHKWIVGFITISFVLCATSLSYSAEVEEIRAAISRQKATWIAQENPISMLPSEERVVTPYLRPQNSQTSLLDY